MLSLNGATLFFTFLNVLVLFLGLKKLLFQPVMNIVEQREKLIREQLSDAKDTKQRAEQLEKEYQQNLKDAHVQADEILMEAKEQAALLQAKELEKTREEIDHMKLQARADLEMEQEKAKQEVQLEIASLAMEAARKIMRTGDVHEAAGSK
ncbi:MAG: F0F1 ATP synthase subunit B [Lachnospiraceae bacterium]|nr:F0F1 ATP synthase subunit B [Lachnospiraceae bacterium]